MSAKILLSTKVLLSTKILLSLLLVSTTPVAGSLLTDLTYSCSPNGAITVMNPGAFTGGFAQAADGTNCTVINLQFGNTIFVGGCAISTNITLWLFNDTTLPTIITDDMDFYVMRCQQIPATGVYRVVTDNSWVTNYMSTSVKPSVTPRILLTAQLEDIESGIERTTALVGEALLWEIEGPEGYIILPTNCTVLSGAGDESIVLVINGCSQDTFLVDHFEYASPTDTHILQANLYAFRFANSEEILIECDMLGCINTSTACDFTCPSRRRRRNIYDDHVRNLIKSQSASARQTATQEERSQGEQLGGLPDIVGQVHNKLRVFGLEDISVNGSQTTAGWPSSLLLSVFTLLFFLTYCSTTGIDL